MRDQVDNQNIIDIGVLAPPREVKTRFPIPEESKNLVLNSRQEIRNILQGRDKDRLLVIAGPCSIHDPEAAYEFAHRLQQVSQSLSDRMLIVMRTYFEKPRTTVGWKGLINDPHLDGSCDIAGGFQLARTVLLHITKMGVPCATEFLDPVTPQYISDLISWSAIGARTTESQTHREMASGLSMPVGFKNGTDGGLQVAINAMVAARHPQSFIGINVDGITSIIKTNGNHDRHIVLRGGGGKVNYGPEDIAQAITRLRDEDISRPVMVDCSHGNSEKDHTRQANVARSVLQQFCGGQHAIMGLLLESHLKPGNQKWTKGKTLDYGISITDACLGWDEKNIRKTTRFEVTKGDIPWIAQAFTKVMNIPTVRNVGIPPFHTKDIPIISTMDTCISRMPDTWMSMFLPSQIRIRNLARPPIPVQAMKPITYMGRTAAMKPFLMGITSITW